jgi:hypothetical protein
MKFYLLAGGFNHREKYDIVNGNEYPIYEMENKKWLKTPTSC